MNTIPGEGDARGKNPSTSPLLWIAMILNRSARSAEGAPLKAGPNRRWYCTLRTVQFGDRIGEAEMPMTGRRSLRLSLVAAATTRPKQAEPLKGT